MKISQLSRLSPAASTGSATDILPFIGRGFDSHWVRVAELVKLGLAANLSPVADPAEAAETASGQLRYLLRNTLELVFGAQPFIFIAFSNKKINPK